MRTPALSVIIPTKDRPNDLLECVNSILRQDHLPQELVVVDQSATCGVEETLRAQLSSRSSSTQLVYLYAPEVTGIPQARNLGVSQSKGEIIMFLDDDVVLKEGYISEILRVFSEISEAVGLGGAIYPHPSRGHALLVKVFDHGPFRGERQILTLQQSPLTEQSPIPMTYLSGCNVSFRRSIFAHYRFDERLMKYALGEDRIFSYLVSRHYELFLVPTAQVFHTRSSINRGHIGHLKEAQVLFYFYFYSKHLPKTLFILFAYLWCNLGLIVGTLFKIWQLPRVHGLFRGYGRILRTLIKLSSIEEELREFYS